MNGNIFKRGEFFSPHLKLSIGFGIQKFASDGVGKRYGESVTEHKTQIREKVGFVQLVQKNIKKIDSRHIVFRP